MPLSSLQDIRDRVSSGVDCGWMSRKREDQRYLYGLKRGDDVTSGYRGGRQSGKIVPHYPDLPMILQEQGVSRRVLDNAFLRLARMQSSDIVPRFPQVPEVVEEARRQFWLARMRGDGLMPGGWANIFARTAFEGDQLGVSYTQFGLKVNPVTGKQRVVCRHAPLLSVIRDPEARDPHSATWAVFIRHISTAEAARLYGPEEAKKASEDVTGAGGRSSSQVRVLDYFDIGVGGSDPTMATFLGDIDGYAPEKMHGVNAFGIIPYAARVHMDAPGLDHEIGLVERQKATHEELNAIEREIARCVRLGPMRVVNTTRIHPDDLAAMNDKKVIDYLRAEVDLLGDKGVPIADLLPGAPVDPTLWQRYGQLVQQLTIESGVTGADMGLSSDATATEAGIVDARSQVTVQQSDAQQTLFYMRCVEVAMTIAERYDRDPLTVDLFRRNIRLNDPQNPGLWMDAILSERSTVEIDIQPMTSGGANRHRLEAAGLIDGLLPLVQLGTVTKEYYSEQKLLAMGQDPKEAMTSGSQAQPDAFSEQGIAPEGAPLGNQSAPTPLAFAGGRPQGPQISAPGNPAAA